MKASELRIGNYVNVPNISQCPFKIEGFEYWNKDRGKIEKWLMPNTHPLTWEFSELTPISLNEDILLKCGFSKGNAIYSTGYSIYIRKTDFYLRPAYKGGYYWGFNISDEKNDCELNDVRPIEYLHQLQNLYFALMGEELIIEL